MSVEKVGGPTLFGADRSEGRLDASAGQTLRQITARAGLVQRTHGINSDGIKLVLLLFNLNLGKQYLKIIQNSHHWL